MDYDVALSFAGEDRKYVEEVANELKGLGVHVFYDNFETVNLWGKDLYAHLQNVYQKRAKYTVIFISKHYAKKLWTNHERKMAQARAFAESREYILPARFDDTEIEGIPSTVAFIDLRNYSPKEFCILISEKIELEGFNQEREAPPNNTTTEKHTSASVENIPVATTKATIIERTSENRLLNLVIPQSKDVNKMFNWTLGTLIFIAILISVSLMVWKAVEGTIANNSKEITAEKTKPRELIYFMNIQKYRDNIPVELPYKSAGKGIFEEDESFFNIVIQSNDEGYLYLFSEAKNSGLKTFYKILYPTPITNNGSAHIWAKQQIETGLNMWDELPGKEILWLVWTAENQVDLESVRQFAFDHKGDIKDKSEVQKLNDFFQRNKDRKTEAEVDVANQQVTIKGNGNIVIHRIELAHK